MTPRPVLELRLEEIERRMLKQGQHPYKVQREMADAYGVAERTVWGWIEMARQRWRLSVSPDDLLNRQTQLEMMAHELYERALGEREWHEIDAIAHRARRALETSDRKEMKEVLMLIADLAGKSHPDLGVAIKVLNNLARFYGIGQTIKFDLTGVNFAADKPGTKPVD